MDDVTITPSKNGPYLVRGPVKLLDGDGQEFELPRKNIALCRCGGSESKPFCDGTHTKIGFESEVHAPAGKTAVPNANEQLVDTPQEVSTEEHVAAHAGSRNGR